MKKILKNILKKIPYINNLLVEISKQGRYPAGHYYSPIPEKENVEHYLNQKENTVDSLLDIDLNREHQFSVLEVYSKLYCEMPFTFNKGENRYYFNQDWFTQFDAIALYSFLRNKKPKRIIEVGSGFSSAVILDTVDKWFVEKPKITFIEPFPDRLKSILKETDTYTDIIVDNVQNVSSVIFNELESGDLLFIDSSHVLKFGSDLHYLFFKIIPYLPKGVFLHFHDIIYPFEYFQNWLKEGRYWNEIYMLRLFLSHNESWKIHFFNSYVGSEFSDYIKRKMPICMENTGGSIYIEKIK